MSKVLVMPGSPEFEQTAKVIDLKTRRPIGEGVPTRTPAILVDEPPADPADLRGKTLMLNLAVCRGFQCGGFQLSMSRTFAVVDDRAQQEPIRLALQEGRLVDITGQDPKTGFKTPQGSVSKVTQEDTGLQAFVGRTSQGEFFVAIPKNKKQASKYELEIQRTGTLSAADLEQHAMGLSGITVEDVPLDAQGCILSPDSSPMRGKINGCTPRQKRKPVRR